MHRRVEVYVKIFKFLVLASMFLFISPISSFTIPPRLVICVSKFFTPVSFDWNKINTLKLCKISKILIKFCDNKLELRLFASKLEYKIKSQFSFFSFLCGVELCASLLQLAIRSRISRIFLLKPLSLAHIFQHNIRLCSGKKRENLNSTFKQYWKKVLLIKNVFPGDKRHYEASWKIDEYRI